MNKYIPTYDNHNEKQEKNPKHHHEPPKQTVILKCGTATGSVPLNFGLLGGGLQAEGVANGYSFSPVLASVVLDTENLINPTIKIDFSSLISFRTTSQNYQLRLIFTLKKVCKGQKVELGTWTFEELTNVSDGVSGEYVQETESFGFTWCECNDCPDCCRYIVEVSTGPGFNIDFAFVSNIALAATAVGLAKTNEKREHDGCCD